MRLLETCLYRFCVLICLSSAGYMTYLQFKYYLNNDDIASISYQKFNSEKKDEYPTISICFSGPSGWMFEPSHGDFKSANVTGASYYKYLRGLLKEYPGELSDIKFDDVALDIQERFSIKYTGAFQQYGSRIKTRRSPLIPAYQDPTRVCISKDSSHKKGVIQIIDRMSVNSTMLYNVGSRIKIYVQQKGKLIRMINFPDFDLTKTHYKAGLLIILDIGQVDILRERYNSKGPCDQDMENEDEYIIKQSITNIGCIPSFWEKFINSTEIHQTTRRCNSTTDYQNAAHQINDAFKSIGEKESIYKKSCTTMLTSVTTRKGIKDLRVIPEKIKLKFYYTQNLYREIINSQAYTSETLLGQVGGFVGISYELGLIYNIRKI